MLDNFSYADLTIAVKMINGKYETEASGGINLETVRDYAECGVDFVSVGALTHSVHNMDLSLKSHLKKILHKLKSFFDGIPLPGFEGITLLNLFQFLKGSFKKGILPFVVQQFLFIFCSSFSYPNFFTVSYPLFTHRWSQRKLIASSW